MKKRIRRTALLNRGQTTQHSLPQGNPQQPASIDAPTADHDHGTFIVGALLFLLVLLVFLPATRNGFVNYDDSIYVIDNAHLRGGITWQNVIWAFRAFYAANWHPLTWLSHMADCQFFSMNPVGHHITSILLHCFNTLLLFLTLRKMTGALWRSALAAALFGLHPVHVESVAWVAERKDVLSTFFWMLTLHQYVTSRKSSGWSAKRSFILAIVCFSLGLASKPMLVTLPFVLMLLDFWPLNRFSSTSLQKLPSEWSAAILEKLPFLALAIVSSVVTLAAQSSGGRGPIACEHIFNGAPDKCGSGILQIPWTYCFSDSTRSVLPDH